jgi:Trp operon repressor
LYTQNDSIVDLLTTSEEKERMSTQPLLEWLFTSEEPGSLRAEYEGAESILEKLNAERKAAAERNTTWSTAWSTGGSGAEKPVPPTAPVVKSLSYMHKNGTWTPYVHNFFVFESKRS